MNGYFCTIVRVTSSGGIPFVVEHCRSNFVECYPCCGTELFGF